MIETTIGNRYAKSLLELATEQGKEDAILEDIEGLRRVLRESRDFELLLQSPVVDPGVKKNVVDQIFKNQVDELTIKFMHLVIDKQRGAYLVFVTDAYIEQYRVQKGITTAVVSSAVPLKQELLDEIRRKLLSSGKTLATVDLVNVVDPDLIGGFVVEFQDYIYDVSVSKRLNDMLKTLTA